MRANDSVGYAQMEFRDPWMVSQARQGILVCVSGLWVGVDSIREQKNIEARKLLVNRAESHKSAARFFRLRIYWISCLLSLFPVHAPANEAIIVATADL